MSEDSKPVDKKKRAAKRYPYQRAASSEINGQVYEIQLLNISTTGIQFATRSKIETKTPICIKWNDSKFGAFDPTFLIARTLENPNHQEFKFLYGAQYFSLAPQAKDKLLQLLKSFKEESSQEILGDDTISAEYLFDVVKKDKEFFKQLITGEKKSSYFNSMLTEVPEYEKQSFSENEEHSHWIQQLATQNFHCHVLRAAVMMVVASSNRKIVSLLECVNETMEKISQTENDIENERVKITQSQMIEENKKIILQRFNESSNRVFYSKQTLLKEIIDSYSEHVFDIHEKGIYEKLAQIYDQMISITSATHAETAVVYSRKTKKPEEFSKVVDIGEVSALDEKKPNFFLIFMIFIALCLAGGLGYSFIDHARSKVKLADEIGIEIQIVNHERVNTQLNIIFSASDWKRLPKEVSQNIMEKISLYLANRKDIRSVVILDDGGNIIRVLDKNKPIHK